MQDIGFLGVLGKMIKMYKIDRVKNLGATIKYHNKIFLTNFLKYFTL